MYGFIYCAQNLINQKRYIGQTTTSLKRRTKSHEYKTFKKNNNTHFHNALRKYGMNNFMWTIICYVDDKEALDKAEIYWIKYYDTIEIGYNHQGGGYNGKPSLIARKKMSIAHKGNTAWNKGKLWDEETKLKMSCSRLGKKPWNKGKCHTKKTREKISKACIGRDAWNKGLKGVQKAWNKGIKTGPMPEEYRKKISEAGKNRIVTEETKLKISFAMKERWANPESRKILLETRRKVS